MAYSKSHPRVCHNRRGTCPKYESFFHLGVRIEKLYCHKEKHDHKIQSQTIQDNNYSHGFRVLLKRWTGSFVSANTSKEYKSNAKYSHGLCKRYSFSKRVKYITKKLDFSCGFSIYSPFLKECTALTDSKTANTIFLISNISQITPKYKALHKITYTRHLAICEGLERSQIPQAGSPSIMEFVHIMRLQLLLSIPIQTSRKSFQQLPSYLNNSRSKRSTRNSCKMAKDVQKQRAMTAKIVLPRFGCRKNYVHKQCRTFKRQ